MAQIRAVTLKDLARRLGVDSSLVSRVLRNDPGVRVSAEKRQQIVALAAALDYRPNRMARALKSRTSHVLALIVPDVTNPFYAVLFRAVESAALARGYTVILCNTDEQTDRFHQLLDIFGDLNVDGWLVATSRKSDPYIERLRERGARFILVNRQSDHPDVPWVGPDDVATGKLAAHHLLALGHRRIAYVTADLQIKSMRLRYEGFRSAFAEFSSVFDERLLLECGRADAHQATTALLNVGADLRPTAFFVSNSFTLERVWAAIRDIGLRIPQDVSLAAYNPIPDASFSGILVPVEEIGRWGTQRLIEQIGGTFSTPASQFLPVSFVDLGTTAPPPR